MSGFDHDRVTRFFEGYGEAVAAGDLPRIAGSYLTPALVLGPGATIPVATGEEVEAAFRGAADAHRARGLVTARATVERLEPITDDLAMADIRWEYLDAEGRVAEGNDYRYVLRRSVEGALAI